MNEIDTSNWLIQNVIPAFPSLFCWWLLVAKSESPKRRSDWNKKKPLAVTDYVDGHGPDSRPTGISGAQLIMTASSPSITKVLLARKWIYWSCARRLRRYKIESEITWQRREWPREIGVYNRMSNLNHALRPATAKLLNCIQPQYPMTFPQLST